MIWFKLPRFTPQKKEWISRVNDSPNCPPSIPFSGIAAIDGSATDTTRKLLMRGGAAVAVPTAETAESEIAVHLDFMLCATYPYDNVDSESCEIFGVLLAIRNCAPPVCLLCDCLNVVRDIHGGEQYCTRFEHAFANVWRDVWDQLRAIDAVTPIGCLDITRVQVVKVAAHTSWETARANGVPRAHWQLNRWADEGAKDAAKRQLPPVDISDHVDAAYARAKAVQK